MPSPNRDDVHPLVEEPNYSALKAVIEGPIVDLAVLVKSEATVETLVHP